MSEMLHRDKKLPFAPVSSALVYVISRNNRGASFSPIKGSIDEVSVHFSHFWAFIDRVEAHIIVRNIGKVNFV